MNLNYIVDRTQKCNMPPSGMKKLYITEIAVFINNNPSELLKEMMKDIHIAEPYILLKLRGIVIDVLKDTVNFTDDDRGCVTALYHYFYRESKQVYKGE